MNTVPILRAVNLAKSFRLADESIVVLKGLNIELKPGEFASIRGESGSGKSTLLNLLSGLETPDEGQVFWGPEDVTKFSGSALAPRRARHLGLVFQSYHLVPELNVLENIHLASRIAGKFDDSAKARALQLLQRVGLGHRLQGLPNRLSGGERQRVAVARALVNQPAVVLADEPTGNLDEKTAESVLSLIVEVCAEQGAGLLLVTHSADFAQRAQTKMRLRGGILEVD